jgi:hypothetical protein
LAVGSWQLAVGGWRLAVGSWQLAVGGWRLAVHLARRVAMNRDLAPSEGLCFRTFIQIREGGDNPAHD